MRPLIAAVLLLALTACSGETDASEKPPKRETVTNTPRKLTLAEACPTISDLLDTDTGADWNMVVGQLNDLAKRGDAQVDALIAQVMPAAMLYADSPEPGDEALRAFDETTDAKRALADTCP